MQHFGESLGVSRGDIMIMELVIESWENMSEDQRTGFMFGILGTVLPRMSEEDKETFFKELKATIILINKEEDPNRGW
jgi:hypothetical protein